MANHTAARRTCLAVAALALAAVPALAEDITGVLPASLDQPRVYLALSRGAKDKPLAARVEAGALDKMLGGMLGGDAQNDGPAEQFAIEAFLDTGASGVMLAKSTATGLGLTPEMARNGADAQSAGPVKFYDVGVAGSEAFDVGPSLFARTSDYGGNTDGDDLSRYAAIARPIRVSLRESEGLIDELTGGVDIAGMPVMAGRVMVCDVRPLNELEKMKTSIVRPGDASIPRADSAIRLSYVDFGRFTRTEPAAGPGPTLAANPMIGPSPLAPGDATQPVVMTHRGKTAKLTMLLDTGAASSMISVKTARALGIDVSDDGKISGLPAKDTFTLPIGGIGGSKDVHGCFVDAMQLPVARGQPIRYLRVPVLVLDITATDPKTGQSITLDGVFGMNNLVSSASVSTGLTAGVDDIHAGAFDFFVVDHANKELRLTLAKERKE